MNLICPHCQKMVQVPDSQAGQTTNCPQCGGPFTVPLPPPPSPVNPPSPATIPFRDEPPDVTAISSPPPTMSAGSGSTAGSSSGRGAVPPPVGDYQKRFVLGLRPEIVKWIAPACIGAIFLVMLLPFLPWLTYDVSRDHPGQSGASVAFGSGVTFKGEKGPEGPGVAALMMLYFLLVLLGTLGLVGLEVLKKANPVLAEKFLPWRSLALAGLSALLLLFLLLQVLFGFPLESKARDEAVRMQLRTNGLVRELKDEGKTTGGLADQAKENAEALVSMEPVRRRMWLCLVELLNLAALLGALTELCLERRVGKPLPRMVVEW